VRRGEFRGGASPLNRRHQAVGGPRAGPSTRRSPPRPPLFFRSVAPAQAACTEAWREAGPPIRSSRSRWQDRAPPGGSQGHAARWERRASGRPPRSPTPSTRVASDNPRTSAGRGRREPACGPRSRRPAGQSPGKSRRWRPAPRQTLSGRGRGSGKAVPSRQRRRGRRSPDPERTGFRAPSGCEGRRGPRFPGRRHRAPSASPRASWRPQTPRRAARSDADSDPPSAPLPCRPGARQRGGTDRSQEYAVAPPTENGRA